MKRQKAKSGVMLDGKTWRRPTIKAGQPHRDRKNDYRRNPKHKKETCL